MRHAQHFGRFSDGARFFQAVDDNVLFITCHQVLERSGTVEIEEACIFLVLCTSSDFMAEQNAVDMDRIVIA